MHKNILILALLAFPCLLSGQSNLDQALSLVAQNNPTILASNEYAHAQQKDFRTGLVPDDPIITSDYLIGRPKAGGDQFDFQVIQSFDFPTSYSKKGQLADEKGELVQLSAQATRQNILLEAKITCLEIIHLNQKKQVLQRRKAMAEKLVENYRKQFEKEEITALDYNKARIQLLGFVTELDRINNEIQLETGHLASLNGGNEILINDTLYPLTSRLPGFASLADSAADGSLELRWLEQQINVFESQVKVTKSATLPKFEAGYHYQTVLGQRFNGAHLGISLPLWQRGTQIKASEAYVQYGKYKAAEQRNRHFYATRQLYQRYEVQQKAISGYREVLKSMNTEDVLNISLELGEINFITYATELTYYYEARDALAELEKDSQIVLAELFKYQL
jgi:outer membrane protein TolC